MRSKDTRVNSEVMDIVLDDESSRLHILNRLYVKFYPLLILSVLMLLGILLCLVSRIFYNINCFEYVVRRIGFF